MMEQTNSEDNLGVDGNAHDSDLSEEKVSESSEIGEDKAETLQQSTGQYYNLVNKSMRTEFLEDQIREDNFTDLDIICSDGYVQVHRCLLMGASPLLRELLIDKGIADTTAITLPDVSVCLMRHVLSLLYSGRTIISKGEEGQVFNLMTMLQFPVNDLLYRTAMEADFQNTTDLRLMDLPGQVEERDYHNGQCGEDLLAENINQSQDMQENYQNDVEMKVEDDPEAETSAQTVICSPTANGEETIEKIGVDDTILEEPGNISDTEKRKRELENGDEENSTEGIGRRLRKNTKIQSETTPSKLQVNRRVRKAIQRNRNKKRPSKISSDQKESIKEESPPPLQRRLSSSSVSSNGGYLNLARVFLETKKYGGILYNIYGFMDPVKGIQSGKTIAVNAETDNSVDRNS